jgi:spermidine dehydrogenase
VYRPRFLRLARDELGVFFDRETFGADRLTKSPRGEADTTADPQALEDHWRRFLSNSPLTEAVRSDIFRLEVEDRDYLPGLSSAEKEDRLSRMSYKDFLLNVAKADPGVVAFYQTRTNGEWGVGIDAEPALDCWALGLPGFQGMKLEPGAAPHMSYSAAG